MNHSDSTSSSSAAPTASIGSLWCSIAVNAALSFFAVILAMREFGVLLVTLPLVAIANAFWGLSILSRRDAASPNQQAAWIVSGFIFAATILLALWITAISALVTSR